MFENMTYDNIMIEMMDDMPDDISTQEGSLIFNACSKMALKLEENYIAMEYIFENMTPDSMDEEHLIKYAVERGITIKEATYAVLQADFKQVIEIGTRFGLNDMNYVVTESITGFSYKVECETAGKNGNTMFGELAPIDYVEDWKGGKLTKVLIPGEDAQDIEDLRQDIFKSFDTKEFSGNRVAYIKFFNSLDGVGGVKIKRRDPVSGYINATIITSDFCVPSQELVEKTQTAIDPEENGGDGVGFAPICHRVTVLPVQGVKINIDAQITFDIGYDAERLQSYIENAVDNYFSDLAKTWEETSILTVRIFQVIAYVAKVTGVIDMTNVTLNGLEDNISLNENQIPERGDINVV